MTVQTKTAPVTPSPKGEGSAAGGTQTARLLIRLVAISLLLGPSSACVRWQVETVSPARLVTDQHPRSVRVVLKDGTEVLIADPVVRSDSIAGLIRLTADVVRGPYKPIPVAVAMADVASVSVATVDTRKTLLLLGATGIAAALVLLLTI